MISQRKLDMVGTWWAVGKRAKRMPDITVETTGLIFSSALAASFLLACLPASFCTILFWNGLDGRLIAPSLELVYLYTA